MTRRRPDLAVDVNTFVGGYPFRHVPHPDASALVAVLEREETHRALVGFLPAAWHRSMAAANAELFRLTAPHPDVLLPVPAINPAWPNWRSELDAIAARGAVAIRAYPPQWGLPAGGEQEGNALCDLTRACSVHRIAIILTTRFEDARQRHWMDSAAELSAASVRAMARSDAGARIVVNCAGRSLIEEIHWSLTPDERERVFYDISWIWGPPQDDLAHLFRTVGSRRFLFGSMWPLRLVQAPAANLELLPDDCREMRLAAVAEAVPLLRVG